MSWFFIKDKIQFHRAMEQPPTTIRQIQFADNAIKIKLDSPSLQKVIDVHFAGCMGIDENVIAEYQIIAGGEGKFSILQDGKPCQSDLTQEQVLFQLMQDGLLQLNGASKTKLIFHAAALAHQGQAVILCGKSASGKSSLAAWLTALGLQYMTDEVISLPLETETISGFCRPIVLKSGSAFIWKRWLKDESSDRFLRFNDGSVWIAPTLLNPNGIQPTAVPRLIIFPRYERDTDFQAERLTPAGTLFHLLQHLVNARNFPDYGMAATSRMASRGVAYRLTYSDIEMASEWIQKTIQQS